jgi:two-component system sensor histidine kinase PilS (NtrC family)
MPPVSASDRSPALRLPSLPVGGSDKPLRLYLLYRVALAVGLLLVFFGIGRGPLGSHLPGVFTVVLHLYVIATVAALLWHLRSDAQADKQGQLALFIDILLITVMMHASGGVLSGIGMLIAVSIALGSLGQSGHTALLFAAVASLAVLTEQLYTQFSDPAAPSAYTQAGLLGALFFALALLADRLGRRAVESERLVEQREADLAQLAQLNDYVIQQMRAGVVVLDNDGVIEMMNEAAWVLLGMPVAMRHHPLEQAAPPLALQYRSWQEAPDMPLPDFRATAGGRDLRASFTRIGADDKRGTLIVLEDTAQLTAEVQQLKLASLGRLTAGIAHEVRNPLGAISHAAQLLAESDALPPSDRRMLEIIRHNSQRVNEVVENILKLSRQRSPQPETIVLADWLEQQADGIRRIHGLADDQLQCDVTPEQTAISVDPGQLRQVIDVLTDNAVAHFDRPIDEIQIKMVGGVTNESGGPFLEIRDNGPGIGADARDKLFEPFFTTRNQGTGLGLYIARQLCEANHTRLEYLVPPTGGSCFRLSFPNPRRSRQL